MSARVGGNVRPLDDLYAGLPPDPVDAVEALGALDRSPRFRKALAYFENYPDASVMGGVGRALLYHLIRATGARSALEIGTYLGGGTEVMARALSCTGGLMATLDPAGGRDARLRQTIASWPDPLPNVVQYHNHSSGTFFDVLELNPGLTFDMIVVDGYHEYGYALFDMTMAAKHARPGAVMIVDDFLLPEVFWAARDFAAAHPDWTVIGDVFSRLDPARPFESIAPSLPGTNFLIFVAPKTFEVGERPKAFHYPALAHSGIRGFDLSLGRNNPGGTLHAFLALRAAAPLPATPEQLHRYASMAVAPGLGSQFFLIDPPLVTARTLMRSLEIQLTFQAEGAASRLVLMGKPELIPV